MQNKKLVVSLLQKLKNKNIMRTLKIEIIETEDGLLETSFGTDGFSYLELLGLAEHVKSYIINTLNEEEGE